MSAIKEQRSRHGRRGGRQSAKNQWEGVAEVATRVAQAAVDGEGSPCVAGPVRTIALAPLAECMPDMGWMRSAEAAALPAIAEDGLGKTAVGAHPGTTSAATLLRSLPTPSRSRGMPRQPSGTAAGAPQAQIPQQAVGASGREVGSATSLPPPRLPQMIMAPAVPGPAAIAPPPPPQPAACGPEPWALLDPSRPPLQRNSGYREWLQARGHMAMQRALSRLGHGAGPGAQGASGAGGPGVLPDSATAAQMMPWAFSNELQLQQWFGQASMEAPMVMQGGGSGGALGGLNGSGYCRPPAPSGELSSPWTSEESTARMAAEAVPPPPAQPPSHAAMAAAAAASGWSQACLMATVMPEAHGMDREQIAARLRAAAPCSYDD